MLVIVYLVVECSIIVLGMLSSFIFSGVIMCVFIFFGVMFGVFRISFIWVGVMFG